MVGLEVARRETLDTAPRAIPKFGEPELKHVSKGKRLLVFHRADCRVVAERSGVRPVDSLGAAKPCRICEPDLTAVPTRY